MNILDICLSLFSALNVSVRGLEKDFEVFYFSLSSKKKKFSYKTNDNVADKYNENINMRGLGTQHSTACEDVGESQFGRLEKKPITLSTYTELIFYAEIVWVSKIKIQGKFHDWQQ